MIRLALALALGGCSLYFTDPSSIPPGSTPTPGPKQVFVTSTMYQGGSLGGLRGADTSCERLATAAGLSGTYMAWLSTDAASPQTRMAHSSDDYILVDGSLLAHGWDDLVDGQLERDVGLDETGAVHQTTPTCMLAVAVWSDTGGDGRKLPTPPAGLEESCNSWTNPDGYGALGDVHQAQAEWTDYGCSVPCTASASLYCVEQ